MDDVDEAPMAEGMVAGPDLGNVTSMFALTPSVSVMTPISTMGVGLFGNIIAIGVYHCSCSAHRNLPFYGILKGLLWTNVVGYLAVYPLIIASYINGLKWIGGLHTCNFQGLATLSFGMSYSLLVGCMGFERFLAVCKPKLYAKRVERRKIPFLICLVWVFAVFTAFMPIVGFGEMVQHYPGTWCFVNWRHQRTVGKLYTSILAAELSGVLLLVITCLVSVVGCTVYKTFCLKPTPSSHDGPVEVTGTAVRRLSVRKTMRQAVVPGSASHWLTFHYVVFACTVLGCIIPVVLIIIINVSGFDEDHFATFLAMGFAEFFPASAPWIYMILHQQLWQRFLPRCFSPDLPNTSGRYADYSPRPVVVGAATDQNHPSGDHLVPTEDGCGANNNLDAHTALDGNNGVQTVGEDGTTVDILAIRTAARRSQHRAKQGSWKPLIESPTSDEDTRNNFTPAQPNHQLLGQGQDRPNHQMAGLLNQTCSEGSMTRLEYHALMRMMDDSSREHLPAEGASDLAIACQFGKESTI